MAEQEHQEHLEDQEDRINRRSFLGIAAASGTVLAAASSCQTSPNRTASPPGVLMTGDFELLEMQIEDLRRGMDKGRFTSQSITELYLARVEAIDQSGPTLRSIIEVNPEAVEVAEALDRERREQGPRGPLHGVPILVKDNIATHDRMTTTAGSLALEGSIPSRDSFVAQKLRQAGAVILGKANLSEWANFRSSNSSSGWSARGGQCKNPFVLDRNPCGSSSGSGAAVSANLCAGAIGTETNGSIVCPSNANGLVGVKPTVGLISRSGIIPISHSQDTAGPMTRTISDAAILLSALVGVDSRDPATSESQGNYESDYLQFLDPDGLEGARIGVGRQFFGFHRDVDRLMEESIQEMERAGATIVDEVEIGNRREMGRASYEVMLFEFKADLNKYLQELGVSAPVKNLQEIIEFNNLNMDREMPYFGQEIFIDAQEKDSLSAPEYREALRKSRRLSREEGLDKVMNEHQLNAIVAPTGGPAFVTDLVNGDHFGGGSSTPAAVSGYPNITVPMGEVFGLPVGISFFGLAWSEPTLIRLAYAFERRTGVRRPPEFLPSLNF